MDAEVKLLLRMLDQAYDHKSWHGTNLRSSLRGVAADLAGRRPGPGRHSIAELAVHAAYWKYSVRRRITGEPKGSFAYLGSNWFERGEDLSAAVWKRDLALLREEHRQLRLAVEGLTAADLSRTPEGSETTLVDLIAGAAAHDLYHAGQIQLLKRLLAGS